MLTRRDLLRGLGAGLVGLPLLESLAHATEGFPTRVLFVSRGQGTLTDRLVVPGTSPTDFSFGPILAPLAPFRDRLAICAGIDDTTNILDGSYNGHTRCLLHTWTCRGMVWSAGSGGANPTSAGGISLDQVIAERWAGATPYDSLQFGVGGDTQTIQTHFWKGVGQPLPPENSASAMYQRLFQDLVGSDPVAIAARRSRRQHVLTAVQQQFEAVRSRVSAEDRAKLEIHLASVEGVEQSLSTGALGDACTDPSVDLSDTSTPAVARTQMDLLAMALACDQTRVATLTFGDYQDWPWLDVDFPSGWHDAVHAGPVTVDLEDDLIDTYRWFSDQLAYLLSALDAIPEGGGTLLDHTLVVIGNVFSTGSDHSHTGKAYLLAGGGAGLVGGRHVDFGGAHNGDLFTAILNALGIDESFGDPGFAGAPLTGLFS